MKPVATSQAIERFKPENIVFVISFDRENNRPSGMIAAWSTICSSDPYMIAVALWKKGYTHKLIQDTKEFVVSVPDKSLEQAIEIFGKQHGDKVNKFKRSEVATSKAKFIKPPLLLEATINFECRLEKEVETGDHFLFIGKILASYVNEDKKVLLNLGKREGKRIFQEF